MADRAFLDLLADSIGTVASRVINPTGKAFAPPRVKTAEESVADMLLGEEDAYDVLPDAPEPSPLTKMADRVSPGLRTDAASGGGTNYRTPRDLAPDDDGNITEFVPGTDQKYTRDPRTTLVPGGGIKVGPSPSERGLPPFREAPEVTRMISDKVAVANTTPRFKRVPTGNDTAPPSTDDYFGPMSPSGLSGARMSTLLMGDQDSPAGIEDTDEGKLYRESIGQLNPVAWAKGIDSLSEPLAQWFIDQKLTPGSRVEQGGNKQLSMLIQSDDDGHRILDVNDIPGATPETAGQIMAEARRKGIDPSDVEFAPTAAEARKQAVNPTTWESYAVGGNPGAIVAGMGASLVDEIARMITGKTIVPGGGKSPFTAWNVGRAALEVPSVAAQHAMRGDFGALNSWDATWKALGFKDTDTVSGLTTGEAIGEAIANTPANIVRMANFFMELPGLPGMLLNNATSAEQYDRIGKFAMEGAGAAIKPLAGVLSLPVGLAGNEKAMARWKNTMATSPIDAARAWTGLRNLAMGASDATMRAFAKTAKKIDSIPNIRADKPMQRAFIGLMKGLDRTMQGPVVGTWNALDALVDFIAFEAPGIVRKGSTPSFWRHMLMNPSTYLPMQWQEFKSIITHTMRSPETAARILAARITPEESVAADKLASMDHPDNMVDFGLIPPPERAKLPERAGRGARPWAESDPTFIVGPSKIAPFGPRVKGPDGWLTLAEDGKTWVQADAPPGVTAKVGEWVVPDGGGWRHRPQPAGSSLESVHDLTAWFGKKTKGAWDPKASGVAAAFIKQRKIAQAVNEWLTEASNTPLTPAVAESLRGFINKALGDHGLDAIPDLFSRVKVPSFGVPSKGGHVVLKPGFDAWQPTDAPAAKPYDQVVRTPDGDFIGRQLKMEGRGAKKMLAPKMRKDAISGEAVEVWRPVKPLRHWPADAAPGEWLALQPDGSWKPPPDGPAPASLMAASGRLTREPSVPLPPQDAPLITGAWPDDRITATTGDGPTINWTRVRAELEGPGGNGGGRGNLTAVEQLPEPVIADIVRHGKDSAREALAAQGTTLTQAQVRGVVDLYNAEGQRPRTDVPAADPFTAPLIGGETPIDLIRQLRSAGYGPDEAHAALVELGRTDIEPAMVDAVYTEPAPVAPVAFTASYPTPAPGVAVGSRRVVNRTETVPVGAETAETTVTRPHAPSAMAPDPRRDPGPPVPDGGYASPWLYPEVYARLSAKAAKTGEVLGHAWDKETGRFIVDPDVRVALEHAIANGDTIAEAKLATLDEGVRAVGTVVPELFALFYDTAKEAKDIGLVGAADPATKWRDAPSRTAGEAIEADLTRLTAEYDRILSDRSDSRRRLGPASKRLAAYTDEAKKLEDQIQKLTADRDALLREPLFYDPDSLRDFYHPEVYEPNFIQRFKLNRGKDDAARGVQQVKAKGVLDSPMMANELRRAGVPYAERVAKFGKLTDVRTTYPQRIGQLAQSMAHSAAYNWVWRRGREGAAAGDFRFGTMTPDEWKAAGKPAEFVQVPDTPMGYTSTSGHSPTAWPTKRFGDLANQYVHRDLWYDIVWMDEMAQSAGPLSAVTSLWKKVKTTHNPGTLLRNLWSNVFLLAPMAGINPWNPANWKYYQLALEQMTAREKSPLFMAAHRYGAFDGDFARADISNQAAHEVLRGLFGNMQLAGEKVKAVMTAGDFGGKAVALSDATKFLIGRMPGIVYSAVDDFFRQAKFLKEADKHGYVFGPSPRPIADAMHEPELAAAAKAGRESFLDYSEVNGFTHYITTPPGRGGGAARTMGWLVLGRPFFRFPAKATPLLMRELQANPWRAMMMAGGAAALQGALLAQSDITDEEAEWFLGENRKRLRTSVLKGIRRDEEGELVGDFRDVSELNVVPSERDPMAGPDAGLMDRLQSVVTPQTPIGSDVAALIGNRAPGINRPVWDTQLPGDAKSKQALAFAGWMLGRYLPPWFPGAGYYAQLADDAAEGKVDRIGRVTTPEQAFDRRWFGSKVDTVTSGDVLGNVAQRALARLGALDKEAMRRASNEAGVGWMLGATAIDELAETSARGTVAKRQVTSLQRANLAAVIRDVERSLQGAPGDMAEEIRIGVDNARSFLDDITDDMDADDMADYIADARDELLLPLREVLKHSAERRLSRAAEAPRGPGSMRQVMDLADELVRSSQPHGP